MSNQHIKTIIRIAIILAMMFSLNSGLKAQTEAKSQAIADKRQSSDEVQVYSYPRISPQNENFKVKVNGKDIFVYNTSSEPFAAFSGSGILHI